MESNHFSTAKKDCRRNIHFFSAAVQNKNHDNYATFYSKEEISNKPQLIVFAGALKIAESEISSNAYKQ